MTLPWQSDWCDVTEDDIDRVAKQLRAGQLNVVSGGILVQKFLIPEAGVWNRPLFLLGVMLFVLGVQIVGFGLVGEIIIYTRASALREYRIERIYEQPERED